MKEAIVCIVIICLAFATFGCGKKLTINDNGYAWKASTEKQKLQVSKILSGKYGHKLSPEDYMLLMEIVYAVPDATPLPIRVASVLAMKLYSEDEDEAQRMIRVMKIWRDPEKLEKSFADDLLRLR